MTPSPMDSAPPSILLVVRWPVGGIRTFLSYMYNCKPFAQYQLGMAVAAEAELETLRRDLQNRSLDIFPCEATYRSFYQTISRALSGGRYQIVHSHGLTSAVYSYLPALLYRATHVITLHDTFNDNLFSGVYGKLKHRTLAHVLASAAAIHCVTHDVRNNLIKYFPDVLPSKIFGIPSGIRVEQFATGPKRDLRAELGLSDNHFLIGFFGRFMAPKGFRYLVDAIRILSESKSLPKHPVVVAFGWGGYIREDQAYIDKLGVSDYFQFLPSVEDVAPSIRGVDVVAMPSLHEACGLLAMEAMVAGVPVIATNCIGLREVISGTPTTVVPPSDARALSEALQYNIANANILTPARQFSRDAAKRFDITNAAIALNNLYIKLIN